MPMNAVQFQPGLSLPEFLIRYGTEAKCRRALFRTRWPNGYRCPRCACRTRSRFDRGGQTYYQCRHCRHQATLVSGTLFEATKLPLTTWFLGLYLLTSTKTNLAALELKRHLGVSYRTAWRLKHKVMQAMAEREETRQLSGFVQIDDAYLGGERNGGKGGRGSENKQAFLAAVEVGADSEHPRHVVFEPVRHFDNTAIQDWSARRLAPQTTVYSDGLWAFRRFGGCRPCSPPESHGRTASGAGRSACAVGEYRAVQPQAILGRHLPRDQATQIRAPISRRGSVPVQPTLSATQIAAAIACCRGGLRPLCGATSTPSQQLSRLRIDANQVNPTHSSPCSWYWPYLTMRLHSGRGCAP